MLKSCQLLGKAKYFLPLADNLRACAKRTLLVRGEMKNLLIWLMFVGTCLCSCLQFSKVLTQDSEDMAYKNFQAVLADHDYLANLDTNTAFQLLPDYEKSLTATLKQKKVTAPAEVTYVQKIIHKVRSMLAYGNYTRCFVVPEFFRT